MDVNITILAGRLTRDVEVRYIPSGSAVATLALAVNESYKNKSGEKVDSTTYVDVEVWGKTAENCAQYLAKGKSVMVQGKLKLDTWQDKDGKNRQKLKVSATTVQFLDGPSGSREDTESKPRTKHPDTVREEQGELGELSAEDDGDDDPNVPF